MYIQLSSAGMVSLGRYYFSRTPTAFPTSHRIIAPFWESNSLSRRGALHFVLVNNQHTTLSHLLEPISTFISDRDDTDFEATWLLLVHWEDTCPYNPFNRFCGQVSYSQ